MTYASVTSTLALFLALTTGTAYAAAAIPDKAKPQPPNAQPDLKGRPTQVSGPAEREEGIDGTDRGRRGIRR
jgi:hypothetical protein